MEKPSINTLMGSFDDVRDEMARCINMNTEGADLQDICKEALFALNRAIVILNSFILREET